MMMMMIMMMMMMMMMTSYSIQHSFHIRFVLKLYNNLAKF